MIEPTYKNVFRLNEKALGAALSESQFNPEDSTVFNISVLFTRTARHRTGSIANGVWVSNKEQQEEANNSEHCSEA